MSEVLRGACLCGKVNYEVNAPEAMCACHCTRCQRWSGTGSTVVLVVDPKNFRVTNGEDLVKRFHEESFADRYFCGHCGSSLYVGEEKLYVGAGTFKGVELKPAFHVQVAHKAPWDEIGGTAPQYPEWSTS